MDLEVVEKGLLLFIEHYDDKIAEMTRQFVKLDYIDQSDEILMTVSQALITLKRIFASFAQDALTYMTPAQVKEVIF